MSLEPSLQNPHSSRRQPAPINALHVLHISTTSPRACLEAVQASLGRVGGQVRAFSLRPVGARFEAVLRLTGLPDAAAARAADLIAAWPEAGQVSLEHHLGPKLVQP
jgi:hypothetical protein